MLLTLRYPTVKHGPATADETWRLQEPHTLGTLKTRVMFRVSFFEEMARFERPKAAIVLRFSDFSSTIKQNQSHQVCRNPRP